ncbi:MAG TPA: glycoside hydrolase domain-containing protein, partial [Propionibacteriaceae bacterium]|nr:glycoside hydrolase domain-containing protein [Propionibacteriaceae bacterium]
ATMVSAARFCTPVVLLSLGGTLEENAYRSRVLMKFNRLVLAAAAFLFSAGLLAAALPAAAEPATTVNYPNNASATRFNGYAFDACTAPSVATMKAWTASPYDAVGVYVGGVNRSCAQPNLTPAWVSTVSAKRWRLIPIYVGHQAPCTGGVNKVTFTASSAAAKGAADAADAVTKAKALGMLTGSAIYGDMENYSTTDATCRTAVLTFVSAWTKELHRQGYLSGMYANLSLGATQLADAYNSTSYARPDALWIARWDSNPALTGWAGIPDSQWSRYQRGKQYRGDHNETYGGVTINIDSDRFDAPVATVGYNYRTTSSTDLNGRRGPTTSAAIVKTYAPGSTLKVVCQTPGTTVGTTAVWDKLSDGNYVSDYYVSTPSQTTYSAPLPRCSYPYQVTSTLNERTGPGSGYSVARTLPSGALAWIYCQRSGSAVNGTSVWDRLQDTYYVSDYYVATPSKTSYSAPIPRC